MVYLSFPTEQGTLYSLEELRAIREVCDKYGMYLFVDGAELVEKIEGVEEVEKMDALLSLAITGGDDSWI